jgi:uncharacterized protein YegJ (DUF2314 family)
MSYEKRSDGENVFDVQDNDAQMNWAMEKARLTLEYFKECLPHPKADQYGFSLKVKLQDKNGTEHIWMNDLSVDDDGLVYGIIDNDPVVVKNVSAGARIGIPIENVSDWLIVEDGRLIGGYTIRVYRESLSPSERASFDQGFGLQIDYGLDFFEHNMRTPEGAILCLEDAYTQGDVAAAVACKDFQTEARMLLSQIPSMDPDDEELVTATAQTLRLSFEAHLQSGDSPNFTGVLHAFPEREFIDANTVVVSEICYHPDGRITLDRLVVTKLGDEWRVGPPVNQDEAE